MFPTEAMNVVVILQGVLCAAFLILLLRGMPRLSTHAYWIGPLATVIVECVALQYNVDFTPLCAVPCVIWSFGCFLARPRILFALLTLAAQFMVLASCDVRLAFSVETILLILCSYRLIWTAAYRAVDGRNRSVTGALIIACVLLLTPLWLNTFSEGNRNLDDVHTNRKVDSLQPERDPAFVRFFRNQRGIFRIVDLRDKPFDIVPERPEIGIFSRSGPSLPAGQNAFVSSLINVATKNSEGPPGQNWPEFLSLARVLNVRFLIWPKSMPLPTDAGFLDRWDPVFSAATDVVYENQTFHERAFIANEVITDRQFGHDHFEPRAMIQHARRAVLMVAKAPDWLDSSMQVDRERSESVRVLAADRNSFNFRVTLTAPRTVVISNYYVPGWRAWIDDTETAIYRVNEILQGIYVPPGTHRIEMRYRTFLWEPSIGLAMLGLVLFCAVIVLTLKQTSAQIVPNASVESIRRAPGMEWRKSA